MAAVLTTPSLLLKKLQLNFFNCCHCIDVESLTVVVVVVAVDCLLPFLELQSEHYRHYYMSRKFCLVYKPLI